VIGMTFCSGIGAPEVAAPWVDWRLASEIEKFPRAVLRERFGYRAPDDHNQGEPLLWGDMTEISPDLLRQRGVPLPDLIVAGTPCQAFSVAGARKGLEDPRGNLTLAFVEICHAIVAARPDGKLAVLWENVPGVLNDKGNAFGCFLGGLVGAVDALPPPGDGSWPGEGMVEGPRARAAWAVLDAQWFGVAQRRRRVFVVVDFGGCVDPAAVLLEPDRLRGNSPPRREQGEEVTAYAAKSIGSGKQTTETLMASAGSKLWLGNQDAFSGDYHVITPPINPCLLTSMALRYPDAQAYVVGALPASLGHGLGHNKDEFITIDFGAENSASQGDGVSEDIVATLDKRKIPAVCFEANMSFQTPDQSGVNPKLTRQHHASVCVENDVRRLTPTECHRLQGFPDDHCAITYRGKPAADGPQYKALGNSMAVPVIRWIMDRMRISMGEEA
jgi:site-specific DNA-cytosine methylase